MSEQRIVYGMEVSLRLRSVVAAVPLSPTAAKQSHFTTDAFSGHNNSGTGIATSTTAFLYSPGPADPRLLVKRWDDPARPQSNFDLCVFRIEPANAMESSSSNALSNQNVSSAAANNPPPTAGGGVMFGSVIHLVHNFSGRYLAVVRQPADPKLHPENHFQLQLMTKEEAGRACRLRLSSRYKRRSEGDFVVNKDVCYLQYETGALGLNADCMSDSLEDAEATAAEDLTPFDVCVYDNTDPNDGSRQSILRAGIAGLIFHREKDALLITEGKSMTLTQEFEKSKTEMMMMMGQQHHTSLHSPHLNGFGYGHGGGNALTVGGGGGGSASTGSGGGGGGWHSSPAAGGSATPFRTPSIRRTQSHRKATLVNDNSTKSVLLGSGGDMPFFRKFESPVTNLDPESIDFDCSALWFIDLVDPTVGGPIRTGRPCRLRHGATNKYLCVSRQKSSNTNNNNTLLTKNSNNNMATPFQATDGNPDALISSPPPSGSSNRSSSSSPNARSNNNNNASQLLTASVDESIGGAATANAYSPDNFKMMLQSLDLSIHVTDTIFELEMVSADESTPSQTLQGKLIFSARSYLRVRHHATGMYLATKQIDNISPHSLAITLSAEPTMEDTLAIVVVPRNRQADLTFLMGNASFLNAYIRLFKMMQKPTSHYKYGDKEVDKVIERTKASLQSLIKFCTESDCDDVLKREGIPVTSHQNSMFEVQMHKLALEVFVAPFVSANLLHNPYQLSSLENGGGVIPFAEVKEHEKIHQICCLVFRLLKQMSKGSIYAAQLLEYFDFMQSIEGYKFRISDTLMEIVSNNRAMLKSDERCKKDIDHNIKMLRTKERSSGYVKYLSLMCICNERGIVPNQRYICKLLFEQFRGEILLPLQLGKVPKRQGRDLIRSQQMREMWSSVLGMNTDDWDPTLRVLVPPPRSSGKESKEKAAAAANASSSSSSPSPMIAEQWLPLEVFLQESYDKNDKVATDAKKKMVKFFASTVELIANLCVGLDFECHRKISQWLPVESIIVALDPSIQYNDAIRSNFFNVAHNLIVRRALNDIGRDSHQTRTCGDLVVVEAKSMLDYNIPSSGENNNNPSPLDKEANPPPPPPTARNVYQPFNTMHQQHTSSNQNGTTTTNLFGPQPNRIRNEDLMAVKKLSLDELGDYSRHERLLNEKQAEDYNKLLLSLTSIWHSIVTHEAYTEEELTTAVDSVIRILTLMLGSEKKRNADKNSGVVGGKSKKGGSGGVSKSTSSAVTSSSDSTVLVIVKTAENNIETLKTKITLIHFLIAVLKHELSRIADTVMHMWAKEGKDAMEKFLAKNGGSKLSSTGADDKTDDATADDSASSSSTTSAFLKAQHELEILRKVRLQEEKLFRVLFELTCHEDQQLVNASLELGVLLCNSGAYLSDRIKNAEPMESFMASELFPYIASTTSKIKKNVSPSGVVVNEEPVKQALDSILQHAESLLSSNSNSFSTPKNNNNSSGDYNNHMNRGDDGGGSSSSGLMSNKNMIRRKRGPNGGIAFNAERPLIAKAWSRQLPTDLIEFARLLGRSGLPEILINSLDDISVPSQDFVELLLDFFNLLLISDEVAKRLGSYIEVFSSILDSEKNKDDAAMIVLAILRCNKSAARWLSQENIRTLVSMMHFDQSGAISQGLEYITLGQYPIPQNQRQVLRSIMASHSLVTKTKLQNAKGESFEKEEISVNRNSKEHELILNRSKINLIACCCVNNSTCRAMVAKSFKPQFIMEFLLKEEVSPRHIYPYYKLLASGFLICEEEWTASAIKVQKLEWLNPTWWNLVELMLKKLPPNFAYSNGQDFVYTPPPTNSGSGSAAPTSQRLISLGGGVVRIASYSSACSNDGNGKGAFSRSSSSSGQKYNTASPSLNPSAFSEKASDPFNGLGNHVFDGDDNTNKEFSAPLVFEGVIPCLTAFYRNLYASETHKKAMGHVDVTHITWKAMEVAEWILCLYSSSQNNNNNNSTSHETSSSSTAKGIYSADEIDSAKPPKSNGASSSSSAPIFTLPKGYIGAAQNFLQAMYPLVKSSAKGGGSDYPMDSATLQHIPVLIEKLGKLAWKRDDATNSNSTTSSSSPSTAKEVSNNGELLNTPSTPSSTPSSILKSFRRPSATRGHNHDDLTLEQIQHLQRQRAAEVCVQTRQEISKLFAEEWSFNSHQSLAPLISILNDGKMLHDISHSNPKIRQYHQKIINHILHWDLSTDVTIAVLASFRIALRQSEEEGQLVEAQNYLNDISMLRVITEIPFFQRPDVTREACLLAIGILENGNTRVQDSLLHYFLGHDERFFHDVDRMLKHAIEDSEQHRTRVANASYYRGHDSPLRFPNVECTFRFLQLMCEGHHRGLQDYLHSQRDNLRSCNIIKSVVLFASELTTHMLDTENIRLLLQTLALLVEVCQGPSIVNQTTLVTNGVFVLIGKILTNTEFHLDIDELQRQSDARKLNENKKRIKNEAHKKNQQKSIQKSGGDGGKSEAGSSDEISSSSANNGSSAKRNLENEKAGSTNGGIDDDEDEELDDVQLILHVKCFAIKLILALFEGGSTDGTNALAMITQLKIDSVANLAQSLIGTRMFRDGEDEHVCDLVYDIMIAMHIVVNSVTVSQARQHNSVHQSIKAPASLETAQKLLDENKNQIGLLGRIEIERDEKIERVYFRVPAACSLITEETKNQLFWAIDRSTQGSKLSDFLDKADEVIYDVQWLSDTISSNWYIKHLARFPLRFWDDCSLMCAYIINVLFVFVMVDAGGLLDKETDWMGIEGFIRIFAYSQLVVTSIALILDGVLNFPLILYKKRKQVLDNRRKQRQQQAHNNSASPKNSINGGQQPALTAHPVDESGLGVGDNSFASSPASSSSSSSTSSARDKTDTDFDLTVVEKIVACMSRSASLYRIASFCFAAMGFWYSDFFFAFHLLGTIKKSSVLENVVVAVTQNGRSLLLTGLLGCMFVYLFAIVAFVAFRDHFEDNSCVSLAGCVLHILTTGLRQGGGIGDQMTKLTNSDPNYISRVVFDFLFWAFMIVIFLNILFGIIIDTFAELRDEKSKKEEDMRTRCFICGIDSYTFDRYGDGFAVHESEEHNVWQYLYFIHHLSRKKPTDYNGQESYVAECIKERDICFFPNKKCTSLSHMKLSSTSGGGHRGEEEGDGGGGLDGNGGGELEGVSTHTSNAIGFTAAAKQHQGGAISNHNGQLMLLPHPSGSSIVKSGFFSNDEAADDGSSSAGGGGGSSGNLLSGAGGSSVVGGGIGGMRSGSVEQSILRILQRFEHMERQKSIAMLMGQEDPTTTNTAVTTLQSNSSLSTPPIGRRQQQQQQQQQVALMVAEETKAHMLKLEERIEEAKFEYQLLRKFLEIVDHNLFYEFNRFLNFMSESEANLRRMKENFFVASISASINQSEGCIRSLRSSNIRLQAELDGVKARLTAIQYENSPMGGGGVGNRRERSASPPSAASATSAPALNTTPPRSNYRDGATAAGPEPVARGAMFNNNNNNNVTPMNHATAASTSIGNSSNQHQSSYRDSPIRTQVSDYIQSLRQYRTELGNSTPAASGGGGIGIGIGGGPVLHHRSPHPISSSYATTAHNPNPSSTDSFTPRSSFLGGGSNATGFGANQ